MKKQVKRKKRRQHEKSFYQPHVFKNLPLIIAVSLVWLVIIGFIAQEHGKQIAFKEIEIYLCNKKLSKDLYVDDKRTFKWKLF